MLALQKKQRLVKAGSAEKGSKGRASIRNDSTQLDDVVEQAMPRKQPSMRTPQQPHKQKHELEAAESDDDDASAPVITGYVSLASMGWRIPQTVVVGMIHTDRDYLFDLRLGPSPSAAVPVVATACDCMCRAEEIKFRPQKLRAFLLRARACAADEGRRRLLARNATEFAACLRLREQVHIF